MELKDAIHNVGLVLRTNVRGLNGVEFDALFQSWAIIKKKAEKDDSQDGSKPNEKTEGVQPVPPRGENKPNNPKAPKPKKIRKKK